MPEDYIDATFADLDGFYPNSKRKRRESAPVVPKVVQEWDAKPFTKTLPNGSDIELFTVGALASALGRPFASVKMWNERGYLPAPPYRLPTKKDKHGEDHKGRRLYSRAMIEAVVGILDKAGLLQIKRIEWSHHRLLTEEIAEAWANARAIENTPKDN